MFNKSYKHSEIGMTLLMCPWPVKIAGYDINMGPEMAFINHVFLCVHFGTVKTSLMHPWLVEITGLVRPQGSAGQLQSLQKSFTTEEISFWYRNPEF